MFQELLFLSGQLTFARLTDVLQRIDGERLLLPSLVPIVDSRMNPSPRSTAAASGGILSAIVRPPEGGAIS